MIIHDLEQRSPEWYAIRCGKPTMSELKNIITTKGNPSKSAGKYALVKAAEILSGTQANGYSNFAMNHGTETEPEAREMYELLKGVELEPIGFVTDDKERWGASPDCRIVWQDAGVEIKCPVKPEIHMERLLGPEEIPTDTILQVQGSLYITGWDHWDYMSYFRGLPCFIVRVYPDKELHKKIENELLSFVALVDETVEKIRERYNV